ncbi:MAG: hypothetical protein KKD69_09720 [Euryarchaeota archaeon]|nr:hypothetical protein [Euryarchaeota archaeon]MCG2727916.1 hypothetical protein [Candidatus Methanoperedenaceae archaeon]
MRSQAAYRIKNILTVRRRAERCAGLDGMNRIYGIHPVNPVEILIVRRAQKFRVQHLRLRGKGGAAG